MKRREFVRATLGGALVATGLGKILSTVKASSSDSPTDSTQGPIGTLERMPVLFLGHGSPMNAIERNDFTMALSRLGRELPKPRAILVVSAHWMTRGPKVLDQPRPRTIHDFHGFPEELYRIRYEAPGSPETAKRVEELLRRHEAIADSTWGLDHGTWSVLLHVYPKADVPVFQLSLDAGRDLNGHLELARDLRKLRDEGVLIVGSGNVTHNLRRMDFSPDAKPMSWAVEFDEMIRTALDTRDLSVLKAENPKDHSLWREAHPSIEHYLPLLYAVGASDENERPAYPFTGIQAGSLSMRSVRFG